MILYHGVWNLVYIYGFNWSWYKGREAYLWQQSTCWTFILLSGFCWSMGKRQLKNGLMIWGGGFLVTAVTLLAMPQNRVVFGILTCIGSCILLLIPLEGILKRCSSGWGMGVSFLFFLLTRKVNSGYLGLGRVRLVKVPEEWYQGKWGAYMGFPPASFYSVDYFSLLPWFFLFLTGYFLYGLCHKSGWLNRKIFKTGIPGIEVLGRNSLLIYLLHQPILYFTGSLIWAG